MKTHDAYSPQNFDNETLGRLFVSREALLELILKRIVDAGNSDSLAHTLIVGARGLGKTFLMRLAYSKARELKAFGKRFSLSALPEEPYGITSFESLLQAIAANVDPPSKNEYKHNTITVALIENFDKVLAAIGLDGQNRLRAYTERSRNLLLVATAQQLPQNAFEQAAPFYGFFDTIILPSFDIEEITHMLIRYAEADGHDDIVSQLNAPSTQARLKALKEVVGGAPRIWSLFASGLNTDTISDTTGLMFEKLGYLAPLYQEMLWRLSVNERKAVLTLADNDGAMTVKTLAEITELDQKSIGTVLRKLSPEWVIPRDGYLMQYVDKRSTYYQLSDPLTRIVMQPKEPKGESLKYAVDFLTTWFSYNEYDEANLFEANLFPFIELFNIKETIFQKVDEALKTLQNTGSSADILSLPTAIANLLETRLQTDSCAYLRIELAFLAACSCEPAECISNAISAISAKDNAFSLRPEEEKTGQLFIACIRLLLSQQQAGLQTLDFALSLGERELDSRQLKVIAATIACAAQRLGADSAEEILRRCAPTSPPDDTHNIPVLQSHLEALKTELKKTPQNTTNVHASHDQQGGDTECGTKR